MDQHPHSASELSQKPSKNPGSSEHTDTTSHNPILLPLPRSRTTLKLKRRRNIQRLSNIWLLTTTIFLRGLKDALPPLVNRSSTSRSLNLWMAGTSKSFRINGNLDIQKNLVTPSGDQNWEFGSSWGAILNFNSHSPYFKAALPSRGTSLWCENTAKVTLFGFLTSVN